MATSIRRIVAAALMMHLGATVSFSNDFGVLHGPFMNSQKTGHVLGCHPYFEGLSTHQGEASPMLITFTNPTSGQTPLVIPQIFIHDDPLPLATIVSVQRINKDYTIVKVRQPNPPGGVPQWQVHPDLRAPIDVVTESGKSVQITPHYLQFVTAQSKSKSFAEVLDLFRRKLQYQQILTAGTSTILLQKNTDRMISLRSTPSEVLILSYNCALGSGCTLTQIFPAIFTYSMSKEYVPGYPRYVRAPMTFLQYYDTPEQKEQYPVTLKLLPNHPHYSGALAAPLEIGEAKIWFVRS
jgi:hypothetical protein